MTNYFENFNIDPIADFATNVVDEICSEVTPKNVLLKDSVRAQNMLSVLIPVLQLAREAQAGITTTPEQLKEYGDTRGCGWHIAEGRQHFEHLREYLWALDFSFGELFTDHGCRLLHDALVCYELGFRRLQTKTE